MELSIDLLKPSGFPGYITPNTFLKNIHSEPLRKFLLDNTAIIEIMLFQYPVLSIASVDDSISIFEKVKKVSKKNKIGNLISELRINGIIKNIGTLKDSKWV